MYFQDCQSPSDVKTRYRRLAMKHHPDRGGDTETMKAVNLAYEQALKGMHGFVDTDEQGRAHTYRYNEEWERSIIEKVGIALGLRMRNTKVWIVGTWVWIEGDTKPHKDRLKENFRWHSKRQMWYWRPVQYRTKYNPKMTFEDLQEVYGSRAFDNRDADLPA